MLSYFLNVLVVFLLLLHLAQSSLIKFFNNLEALFNLLVLLVLNNFIKYLTYDVFFILLHAYIMVQIRTWLIIFNYFHHSIQYVSILYSFELVLGSWFLKKLFFFSRVRTRVSASELILLVWIGLTFNLLIKIFQNFIKLILISLCIDLHLWLIFIDISTTLSVLTLQIVLSDIIVIITLV